MTFRVVPASFAAAMAAAGLAGIASACGATTDDATPDAAAIGDASGDGATVDAPMNDGPISDGGAGDTGRFCTTLPDAHDFCEDFDEGLYFGTTRWTQPLVGGFGRLRVEKGQLVSEIVEHDSGDANHPAALILERGWSVPLEKNTRRLSLSYRMKVEHCNAILPLSFLGGVNRGAFYSWTAYLEVQQEVDCTAKAVALTFDPDSGAATYIPQGATIPIPIGTFVDYAISLEEIGGTTTFTLRARGMISTSSFPAVARGDIITAIVGAGRPWVYGAPERLEFDDLLFDHGR